MAEPLTVLIADDHPIFRKGLRTLLDSLPDVDVVAEATNGLDAVRLARELQPRLVLLDLQMPGGDGLTAIRAMAVTSPAVHILVVTMFDDDDSVFAAVQAGARGYVLKDADDDELARAVLAVGHGEVIFGAGLAARTMTFFGARPAPPTAPFPELSDSERNVLRLMASGLSNDSIAEQLFLSPKTIRNYVSNVFAKLHVASRAQAVLRARDEGL